jgi:glycosyltransferase involved in cell wall biosynthesis
MKYAIVHDYLTQRGGAERVVLALAKVFPEAPIYTSLYAPEGTYREFSKLDVRTSRLQGKVKPEQFRRSVLSLPGVFSELDLSEYDLVVISSSAFAHHVRHDNSMVYCYTPPHFLYDTSAYLGNSALAAIAWGPLSILRHRDRRAASTHHSYATISRQSARRVSEIYGRSSPVIYPPLITAHLPSTAASTPSELRALIVSRLLPYKRVDVAIKACALAGIGLTIVGEGPEMSALKSLATGDVTFVGRVDDRELAQLFVDHSVVVAPGLEDFGYGPVEANYSGRPVVALKAGGALETIQDDINGFLVDGWDPQEWSAAIKSATSKSWSPTELRATTNRFSEQVFTKRIKLWVEGQLK